MEVKILRENLKKGLAVVERATSKNPSLPILDSILLETENNFLKLSATNLEIGINYWILSKTEKEGKIAIPGKTFSSFINLLPSSSISLLSKDNTLIVESENYKTKIRGFNADEFPIIPKVEKENYISIDSQSFAEGLSQIIGMVSPNQFRPEISGVYLSFQPDSIRMAGTDSFRLAEKKLISNENSQYSFNLPKPLSIILPLKTATELINIISSHSSNEDLIKIYFSKSQVLIEFSMADSSNPQIQVISRLIEGDYPQYQEIIPNKFKTKITLNKSNFVSSIRLASLFAKKVNEVKLRLMPAKKGIEVSAQNPELGEHSNFLSSKIEGEKMEINFNYRFLLDGLSNIKSSEVAFKFTDSEGAAVLEPIGDKSYLYVVMPIKGS